MTEKNLLVFGGTFNPIHYGHLISTRHVLETLKEKFNFEKIMLIPNGDAPHKSGFIAADHRLKMCQLAVEDDGIFEVNDYESKKGALSYTFDTISHLKSQFKDTTNSIYVIIGMDVFHELYSWHNIEELSKMCHFVVMYDDCSPSIFQEGFPMNAFYLNVWKKLHPFKDSPVYKDVSAHFVQIPKISIRSTMIRERMSQGLPITYLVPSSVELYIMNNGLYCG